MTNPAVLLQRLGAHQAASLFALAGVAGIVLTFLFPTFQAAVDHGQVLAGIVEYPPGNLAAYAVYKGWNIIDQVAALLLAAGLGEGAASYLIAALMTAALVQAFALVCFAFTGRFWLSLLVALTTVIARPYIVGYVYPLVLFSGGTWGVLGFAMGCLLVALVGVGWRRPAGFLLGLAPALHITWGAYLWAAVALWSVTAGGRGQVLARANLRPFLSGLAITAASFAASRVMAPDFAFPDPDPRYWSFYFEFWDFHRSAALDTESMWPGLVIAALGLAVAARLWRGGAGLTAECRAMAQFFLTAAALAGVLYFGTLALRGHLPPLVDTLMLARYLGLPALLAFPVVMGMVLGRNRGGPAVWIAVILVAWAYMALVRIPGVVNFNDFNFQSYAVIFAGLALYLGWGRGQESQDEARAARWHHRLAWPVLTVALAATILVHFPRVKRSWALDPAFEASALRKSLAESEGVLLRVRGVPYSMTVRRPTLLGQTGVDMISYAPEIGPAFAEILADVYGIDYFNPPEFLRHEARILPQTGRRVWETRDLAGWQAIGQKYGVGAVLTPPGWQLKLPLKTNSPLGRLYVVPAGGE